MIPHPITDSDSLELAFAGTVKAGFPSPAEEVREKLDLVKLLVQHSASTFFFRIDGISMVDADEKNTKYKPIPVGADSYLTRIPAIGLLQELAFRKPVTFFVGENSGEIKMSREHQSPHYTTLWSDIPKTTVR